MASFKLHIWVAAASKEDLDASTNTCTRANSLSPSNCPQLFALRLIIASRSQPAALALSIANNSVVFAECDNDMQGAGSPAPVMTGFPSGRRVGLDSGPKI